MSLLTVHYGGGESTVFSTDCAVGALNAVLAELATTVRQSSLSAGGGRQPGIGTNRIEGATQPTTSAAPAADGNGVVAPSSFSSFRYHHVELLPLSFVNDLVSNPKAIGVFQQLAPPASVELREAAVAAIAASKAASRSNHGGSTNSRRAAKATASHGGNGTLSNTGAGVGGSSGATLPPSVVQSTLSNLLQSIPFAGLMNVMGVHGAATELGLAPLGNYILLGCRETPATLTAGTGGGGGKNSASGGSVEEMDRLLRRAHAASTLLRPEGAPGGDVAASRCLTINSAMALGTATFSSSGAGGTGHAMNSGGRGGYGNNSAAAGDDGGAGVLYGPRRLLTRTHAEDEKEEEKAKAAAAAAAAPPPSPSPHSTADSPTKRQPSSNKAGRDRSTSKASSAGSGRGSRPTSTQGRKDSPGAAKALEPPELVEVRDVPLSKLAGMRLSADNALPFNVALTAGTVTLRHGATANEESVDLAANLFSTEAGEGSASSVLRQQQHVLERVAALDVLWRGPAGEQEVLSWLLQEYVQSMKAKLDAVRAQLAGAAAAAASAGSGRAPSAGDSKRKRGKK